MFDKIRNKHFASIFSVLGVTAKQLSAAQVSVVLFKFAIILMYSFFLGGGGGRIELSAINLNTGKGTSFGIKMQFSPALADVKVIL
jgi:hypothetical protein